MARFDYESKDSPELVQGTVFALRSWNVRTASKGDYTLVGAWSGVWNTAELQATCSFTSLYHRPPYKNCACGIYGFWTTDGYYSGMPITGVVELWGKATVGTRGVRAEHARIVALHASWPYFKVEKATLHFRHYLHKKYQVPIYLSMRRMLRKYPLTTEYLDR